MFQKTLTFHSHLVYYYTVRRRTSRLVCRLYLTFTCGMNVCFILTTTTYISLICLKTHSHEDWNVRSMALRMRIQLNKFQENKYAYSLSDEEQQHILGKITTIEIYVSYFSVMSLVICCLI